MKIVISSWPGSGATTLALILAKELHLTWIKGTDVFRYLGAKLNFEDTGLDRIKADQVIEDQFGKIFDKYIQTILTSSDKDNFIIESDIAGFLKQKNDKYVSIFLYSDLESRKARLIKDNRHQDEDYLEHRQNDLAAIYKKLHGIEFLNIGQINEKYDIPLDNGDLSLEDELISVYKYLYANKYIDTNRFEKLCSIAIEAESLYWTKGKEFYKDYLATNNLITSPENILKEIKKNFPKEVEKFDDSLKSILDELD